MTLPRADTVLRYRMPWLSSEFPECAVIVTPKNNGVFKWPTILRSCGRSAETLIIDVSGCAIVIAASGLLFISVASEPGWYSSTPTPLEGREESADKLIRLHVRAETPADIPDRVADDDVTALMAENVATGTYAELFVAGWRTLHDRPEQLDSPR